MGHQKPSTVYDSINLRKPEANGDQEHINNDLENPRIIPVHHHQQQSNSFHTDIHENAEANPVSGIRLNENRVGTGFNEPEEP